MPELERYDALSPALTDMIGLGAGGHAKMCIELVRARGGSVRGLYVGPDDDTDSCVGVPVLGKDDAIPADDKPGAGFVGVGAVRASSLRRTLQERCRNHGFELPALVHPSARIADDVRVGPGAQIMPGAIINTGAEVHAGAVVNSGAVVEHDCRLAPFCHVASGARLGGDVVVGECAHVGLGATVLQGRRIGSMATVGGGATVIDAVDAETTVVGVPARRVDRNS